MARGGVADAERLVNTSGEGERMRVAQQIEAHAAAWANVLAAPLQLDYARQRDAHCHARLGG